MERLVSEGISTNPEATEEIIAAPPASQEDQLNRAAALEATTLPARWPLSETETLQTQMTNQTASGEIQMPSYYGNSGGHSADLAELKQNINDSFGEVASLLLELQNRFALLDERIERYNRGASHKI